MTVLTSPTMTQRYRTNQFLLLSTAAQRHYDTVDGGLVIVRLLIHY